LYEEEGITGIEFPAGNVIVGSSISEDLSLAASKIIDVELFEYALSLTLKRVR
jgi:hypothetical protein